MIVVSLLAVVVVVDKIIFKIASSFWPGASILKTEFRVRGPHPLSQKS